MKLYKYNICWLSFLVLSINLYGRFYELILSHSILYNLCNFLTRKIHWLSNRTKRSLKLSILSKLDSLTAIINQIFIEFLIVIVIEILSSTKDTTPIRIIVLPHSIASW
jgi:hypothetical protein